MCAARCVRRARLGRKNSLALRAAATRLCRPSPGAGPPWARDSPPATGTRRRGGHSTTPAIGSCRFQAAGLLSAAPSMQPRLRGRTTTPHAGFTCHHRSGVMPRPLPNKTPKVWHIRGDAVGNESLHSRRWCFVGRGQYMTNGGVSTNSALLLTLVEGMLATSAQLATTR